MTLIASTRTLKARIIARKREHPCNATADE